MRASFHEFISCCNQSDPDRPAQLIRHGTPLDAGQSIVQLMGDLADLTVVDIGNVALVSAVRRPGEMTAAVPVPNTSSSFPSLEACITSAIGRRSSDTGTPQCLRRSMQLIRVTPGRPVPIQGAGVDRAANLEEAVHRSHFLPHIYAPHRPATVSAHSQAHAPLPARSGWPHRCRRTW